MARKVATNLHAALKRLDDQGNPASTGMQRRFKRFPVRSEARLWCGEVSTNPTATTVQVRDVSRGGAGLLSNEPLPQGSYWHMELVDSGLTVAILPAFCRFCREVQDGAYLIGVEFGLEASLILAMGVTAKELTEGDLAENLRSLSGDFVDPESFLDQSQ